MRFAEDFWANVEAAADFEAALVRPSCKTFDAAVAAFADVVFGVLAAWDKALAAAVLEATPVDLLCRTADAFCATVALVVFPLCAAADCARVAKLPLSTAPPLCFAVALWTRDAAVGVMGVDFLGGVIFVMVFC